MFKHRSLIILLFLGLVLRLSLVFIGYHGDLNNNISWGTLAYSRGLNGFYGSSDASEWPYSAPNQPPLTLLLFAGLRLVWEVTEKIILFLNANIPIFPSKLVWFWGDKGMILLVKLPSIIADLLIGLLIYKFIKRSVKYGKKAIVPFCFWLFNPLVWYNSSVWGQTDAVVNLLGLVAVFALLDKKLERFALFFALSLLFKGSLAVFIPLLLIVALKQGHSVKKWILSAIYVLGAVFLTSVWFHPYLDLPIWLFNLYKERIMPGEIGYLTANAFNLWYLVSSGKTPDSIQSVIFSARTVGFIIFGGFYLLILQKLRKTFDNHTVFFSLLLVALISFLFLTRIHERYLYPLFPYATLLLLPIPEMAFPLVILSIIHLFNLYNLFWVPSIPILEVIMRNSVLPSVFSIITITVFIYLLYLFLRQTSLLKK
jgi:Gpi18-like mannosyltransferase